MLSEAFQRAFARHISFWICAVCILPIQSRAKSLSPVETREPPPWTSDVKLHRFPKSIRGSLTVTATGVDFQPEKGKPSHWSLADIRTVDLTTPRDLSLVTYQNRHWFLPGDRSYTFELRTPMPPGIAAELIRGVGKPAINGDPFPDSSGLASIAARHLTRTAAATECYDSATQVLIICRSKETIRELGAGLTFRRSPIRNHTGCGSADTSKPSTLS